MAHLTECFKKASSNIEPNTDAENAKRAHEEVRPLLEANDLLRELGVETRLIGSYGRNVSIRRVKDVDVFVMLPNADSHISGDELLTAVEIQLSKKYGSDSVTRQDHSVKVELDKYDLDVDAVPARPCGEHWEIPEPNGEWRVTDPLRLGELTTEMNDEKGGFYVPTVKFVRQVRRALGIKRPSGLYFEILTYWAFADGAGGSTRAENLASALQGTTNQLEKAINRGGLLDPALRNQEVRTKATSDQLKAALQKLRESTALAVDALEDDDDCSSARKWQRLLGKTPDDEWVFPVPAHCDELSRTSLYVPGERIAPRGSDRFA